jgi:hypothetical protein
MTSPTIPVGVVFMPVFAIVVFLLFGIVNSWWAQSGSRTDANWQVNPAGEPIRIAVVYKPLRGPLVLVNGREVRVNQDPHWNVYPLAESRQHHLTLGDHRIAIIEHHGSVSDGRYGSFELG